jgi:alanine racemase
MPPIELAAPAAATLTVDLGAIVANWRFLKSQSAGETAAVVKADGYGLGATRISAALFQAGCRTFFVAQLGEAVALRAGLPEAEIHVLAGLAEGEAPLFLAHKLVPVLNDLGQIERWAAASRGRALAADIHIDTGMARLGLPPRETDRLLADPARLQGIKLDCLISHLACADEPDHPLNPLQLERLRALLGRLPCRRTSLANSSGVFLGPNYHFELQRPGAALYGINPVPGRANPMRPTIALDGRIIQVRDLEANMSVGYGATYRASSPRRIATVGVGYADGYLRALSSRAHAYIGDTRIALVGRVSMDLLTFDVTGLPPESVRPGGLVELIGPHQGVDALASEAGTIGYEILTSLGPRYARRYLGGAE